MRYLYKDDSGIVYEYASTEERNQYGSPDLVLMTPEEVDIHLDGSSGSKTYKEALAELNATYQADVLKLNQTFSLAVMAGGPTESTKIAAVRAQYESRKTLHTANIASLKLEYGV